MATEVTRQHDVTVEIESGMRKAGDDPKYKIRVVIRTDGREGEDGSLPESDANARALVALEMTEQALGLEAGWHTGTIFEAARVFAARYGDDPSEPRVSVTVIPPAGASPELVEVLAKLQADMNCSLNDTVARDGE